MKIDTEDGFMAFSNFDDNGEMAVGTYPKNEAGITNNTSVQFINRLQATELRDYLNKILGE